MTNEIPKELIESSLAFWWELKEEINSLPTHDPIAVLKEMIEEIKTAQPIAKRYEYWYEKYKSAISILEEAISRITKQ
jgi:hypothetical protein